MELKEVYTVVGKPGLYRYVANAPRGIIMESLLDKKRLRVDMSANVSTLAEIAIYTSEGEFPLWKVLNAMRAYQKEIYAIGKTTTKQEVVELFAKIVPNYDTERVYESNMRKVMKWYTILSDNGMNDFTTESRDEGKDAKADRQESPNE